MRGCGPTRSAPAPLIVVGTFQMARAMTPSALNLPAGRAFRTRCARADAHCERGPPEFDAGAGHAHRCFHPVDGVAA